MRNTRPGGASRDTAAVLGHSSTQVTKGYLGLTADRVKRGIQMRGRPLFPRPQHTSYAPGTRGVKAAPR